MRVGGRVLIAAALFGTTIAVARAEGPYDDRSYWAKVERWQDCALKQQYSPYSPAFAYGPTYTCNYGLPAAQYYAPYGYSHYPCNPYNPYYYR